MKPYSDIPRSSMNICFLTAVSHRAFLQQTHQASMEHMYYENSGYFKTLSATMRSFSLSSSTFLRAITRPSTRSYRAPSTPCHHSRHIPSIPDLAFDPWKDAPSPGNAQVQPTTVQTKSNLLLVIFIHGLKGDNKSFKTFPQRIQDILSKSLPDTTVECVVSPTWETKGELTEAVARFVKWLTLLTEEKEQGVTGSVKIVLCGHSMGGLLAADTILELVRPHRKGKAASIWPRVVACISFDTPYLGLLPPVFKNSVTEEVDAMQTIGSAVFGALAGLGAWKATGQVSPSFDIPRISWNRWVPPTVYAVGGAILAGATWYKRDDFVQFYNLAMDHIKFLDNVGDEEALEQRVNDLVDLEKSHGILFRTLYVLLPPAPPEHRSSRTFILLPWSDAPAAPHFVPVENRLATNEIWAHMGMFAATTNDGYHELEVDVAKIIEDALF